MSSSVTTPQFLAEFRALHDKVRGGKLGLAERATYTEARAQFVRMMIISQMGTSGQTLRSDLRMATMLKVELRPEEGAPERLTTIEVATKGFATLMAKAVPIGTTMGFTLNLPKPAEPIAGRATVASVRAQGTLSRVAFKFGELMPSAAEALDVALIDAILSRLATRF